MIEILTAVAAFLAVAVVAFIASMRVGILLGRRIDGVIEDRAAAQKENRGE
jgi:F0F1-type ATP synthase membrane subunit c/vacuolar-type H+-ATPase subunit K